MKLLFKYTGKDLSFFSCNRLCCIHGFPLLLSAADVAFFYPSAPSAVVQSKVQ